MSRKSDNYLLSKTQLGQVKSGYHKLPEEGHIYGKVPVKDKHGARQVISGWVQHESSGVQQPGNDYVAMNREGIKKGCKDSKQISSYRRDNEIKVKVKQGQKYYGVNIPNEEFIYGIPNRPSTPIKNVVCNTYAAEEEQLQKEREAVMKMLEGDKKKPAKVQSPQRNQKVDRKKAVQENNFKLSKFKNVESKVKPMISEQKNKA